MHGVSKVVAKTAAIWTELKADDRDELNKIT